MTSKSGVPDAWDDDWVNVADKQAAKKPEDEPAPKLTKAERRAQHLVQQKEIWNAAENPGRKLWLEAQGVERSFEQPFAQPMQLLSRRPATVAKKGATDETGKPIMDDDEDSEEERRRKQMVDLEERQRRAKLELEEKQRRYAEARERIMGSSKSTTTPSSRDSSQGRDNRRPRGAKLNNNRQSQPGSPAEMSPAASTSGDRLLFDPDDMGRRLTPKREMSNTPKEDQPSRQPRGPTNSGRGGFGFAARGNQANA